MSVTQPAASTAYGFTGSSDSRSVTVDAAATFLLVRAFSRIAPGAWTATYNSVSLTALTGTLNSGTNIYGEWFYLASPATGSNTMVVTCPNSHPMVVEVFGLAGVNLVTPFHSQSGVNWATSSANPGSTPSVTLTSATGELCLDGTSFVADADVALAVSGGTGVSSMTQIRQGDGTNFERVGGSTAAGSASTTMSWSISGSKTYLQIAVAIQAAAAGGARQSTMALTGAG